MVSKPQEKRQMQWNRDRKERLPLQYEATWLWYTGKYELAL